MLAGERIFRLGWLAILVAEGVCSIASCFLLPGGFPVSHPRFWSNTIAPPSVALFTVVTLSVLHQGKLRSLGGLLLARIWFWVAFVATAAVIFPISLSGIWLVALAISCWAD
jgi:hypothetical protein